MNLFSLLGGPDDDRMFLTDFRNGKSYRYRDLYEASAGLVRLLEKRSVAAGDKIVYFTVHSAFFFPLLFACSARRAALVPLNPKMHADELNNIVKQLSPKIVFFDEEHADVEDAFKDFERIPVDGKNMLCLLGDADRGGTGDRPVPEPGDGKIALIVYTSGTTTHSKGVALTHKNLDAMARNFTAFYGFRAGQRFLSILPYYHINAPMVTGLACIHARAHIFVGEIYGFILAKSLWDIVEHHKIQVMSVTPSIMASLNVMYSDGTHKNTSSVEYALVGTAPLKSSLWREFEERFHIPCFQGYGLTETTTWATMTPQDFRKRYDSAGVPVGCEIRIDPGVLSASDPEQEGSGEVLIRGDILMKGYWGNPQATKAVLVDGWLKTGDVGFLDGDGQLVITGRIKNIVKRKGQLVLPEDIDAAIARHEGVTESCTFGVPDEMLGEKIVTVCVLKDRTKEHENGLYDFARANLSQQNMPDQFLFVGRLPKNDLGKVNLRRLREYVSGQTSREIFAIFDKARYRKAKTPDRDAILEILQASLLGDTPFYLTGYWGVGDRDRADHHDRRVLDNLHELRAEVNQHIDRPLAKIKLILADIHGRANFIPEHSAGSYLEAIAEECKSRGFEHLWMSEIWSQNGLDLESVLERLSTEKFERAWERFPLKEQFIKQAGRRAKGGDAEGLARRYYAVITVEREAVGRYCAGNIFFTHNDLEYQAVHPALPTIYIHSIKPGVSEKPWFMGSAEGTALDKKGER